MQITKLHGWQWVLAFCLAVALLIPAVLAAIAPSLAPLPATASISKWEAPPLPDRETPLPGFEDLIDPLPLVVRDLPDDASAEVVVAYDRSTLFEPQQAQEMLDAATRALPIPENLRSTWNMWLTTLGSETTDPTPVPGSILAALQNDPRNGDRLSNLAVALYFVALTEAIEQHSDQIKFNLMGDQSFRRLSGDAAGLLAATAQSFPDTRSAVLNYEFIATRSEAAPADILVSWVQRHPSDIPALWLLSARVLRSRPSLSEEALVISRLEPVMHFGVR